VGVLISAVLFSVDLCRVGHETAGVRPMRFGEKSVVGGLGVIA
jgi:hypothetical protein